MTVEWQTRIEALDGAGPLVYAQRQWWLDAPQLAVRALAHTMLDLGLRLSTITGVEAPDGETYVIYHYALSDSLLNVRVLTQHNTLDSIAPITCAASWAEREIQDLYGVTFVGLPNPARLVRPPQLDAGFFRENRREG